MRRRRCLADKEHAHAGSRTRVTSMGGLYDAATLRALMFSTLLFTSYEQIRDMGYRLMFERNFAFTNFSVAVQTLTTLIISGVAQWLACWAHNPKVRGSKPRSAIFADPLMSMLALA